MLEAQTLPTQQKAAVSVSINPDHVFAVQEFEESSHKHPAPPTDSSPFLGPTVPTNCPMQI